MRELQHDELIDYYYEIYEEELNAGRNNQGQGRRGGDSGYTNGPSCHSQQQSTQSHHAATDELAGNFNRVLRFSNLNPDAAEFVPRQAQNTFDTNSPSTNRSTENNEENPKKHESTEKPDSSE